MARFDRPFTRLLQHSSGGCTKSDDWQASMSDECCSSCDHWHTQVRPRTVADTAHRTALARCAWVSHVQALHYGAQLPTRSGAAVLGRPLPIPVSDIASWQHLRSASRRLLILPRHRLRTYGRSTGFLCCWPVGLELIAWQSKSVSRDSFCTLQTFEIVFVHSLLKHRAH